MTTAGLALLVTVTTACGGGGGGAERLSRQVWAARANAICASYLAQAREIDFPGSSSLAEGRERFEKLFPVLEDAANRIKELRPAADIEGLVDKFNRKSDESVRLARGVLEALRNGDAARAATLTRQNEPVDREADDLARQLGADTCAEDM